MRVINHPLQCRQCGEFRNLVIEETHFDRDGKGVIYNIPFFYCPSCNTKKSVENWKIYEQMAEEDRSKLDTGQYARMIFPYEKRFPKYDHLGLKYDPTDYFFIPGLAGDIRDGYLTPVFFDKDVLLHYNGHPDYSVRLTSFSTGNIYYKGTMIFSHSFGINRSGKVFMWLGDLEQTFRQEGMESLKGRFLLSNVESDHDVFSKYYLSQIPFHIDHAFQDSDNEIGLFSKVNKIDIEFRGKFGKDLLKLDIQSLKDYYRHPLMEERDQIFRAYLSLNKFLLENIQQDNLKLILINAGAKKKELQGLRSLKLLRLFLINVLNIDSPDEVLLPLFVLYDLRQLDGHLSDNSFDSNYSFARERLGASETVTDLELFELLIKKLLESFDLILNAILAIPDQAADSEL